LRIHEGGFARRDREADLDIALGRLVASDLRHLLDLPLADDILPVEHAQPLLEAELVRDDAHARAL